MACLLVPTMVSRRRRWKCGLVPEILSSCTDSDMLRRLINCRITSIIIIIQRPIPSAPNFSGNLINHLQRLCRHVYAAPA